MELLIRILYLTAQLTSDHIIYTALEVSFISSILLFHLIRVFLETVDIDTQAVGLEESLSQNTSGIIFNWAQLLYGENGNKNSRLNSFGNKDSRPTPFEDDRSTPLSPFPPPVFPNDPEFELQWSMRTIGAPEAWGMWTGRNEWVFGVMTCYIYIYELSY